MQSLIDRLTQHYRKRGPVVLLESQSQVHPASNVTYLAALPEATIKSRGRKIEIVENGKGSTFEANPWDALSSLRKKWGDWLFGYLGYDLKNHIEVLKSGNPDMLQAPDMFFMKPGVLFKIDRIAQTIETLKRDSAEDIGEFNEGEINLGELKATIDKTEYLSKIKIAQHDIYEGSYYEVNLSHQLQAEFSDDAFRLYQKMRKTGPVPFGAFIEFDGYSICSMSPERFLRKQGPTVFSQPIKGTIKRGENAAKDHQLKHHLTHSVKNKAENLMIVDLVRNDLSRIAGPGSVEVANLFEIQSFGTVHQMVSTIMAQSYIDDPVEIIKACYPMGSMTGAPKIRAMQAIEQLENYRRGIYSGAIGYFTPDGDFDFNVVIRTAIIKNDLLCYAVGGAIVSDSDPEEEWNETWLKAEALLKALDN